jgi:pimeloyl-ACP methyl ester carboxylesterase
VYLLDEETIPCLAYLLNKWGPSLSLFSTSNAARDARYVMKEMTVLAADPSAFKTIIYGGSYGTLLCNRILQMEGIDTEPALSTGQLVSKAILDGVVAPDMYHVQTQLYSGTTIAQFILSACGSTSACSDYLGTDPIQFVFDLLEDMADGWCSSFNVTTDDIKFSFGSYPSLTNSIISPVMLVNRLRECNPADAENVKFYIDYLHAAILPAYQEGFKPPAGSFPLLYNVMFGEQRTVSAPLADEPPFLRAYGLESDKRQLGLLYDHMLVLGPQAMWPRYSDPYSSQYPTNITAEILLLQGGADSNTPAAYAFNAFNHLSEIAHTANNGRVALPRIITYTPAGHVILFKTPEFSAVKCVSYFLNSAADPALDSCMPIDSIQNLFSNPPPVDMYLFQYPDHVFTEKYTPPSENTAGAADSAACDCLNTEDSLTQGSVIAFVSFLTFAVFVCAFWFLVVAPVVMTKQVGAQAEAGHVKNPLNSERSKTDEEL